MIEQRYWDDVQVGDQGVSPDFTITESHVMSFAELSGDFTPIHTDEEYAKTTHFGTRVAHGLLGLSLTDGVKNQSNLQFVPGMSLGWTWDFTAPIHFNDTVHVKFRVGSKRLVSRPDWGILVLPTELFNQRGEVVQRGEHRLMTPLRPVGPAQTGQHR